jgi:hypothetical protein
MPYARTVSVVRFVTRLLNNLVFELYGGELTSATEQRVEQ